MTINEREEILGALQRFVRSRPGFESCNYGSGSGYRSDVRVATRQLHHAEAMLAAVSWRSVDAEALKSALKSAFGGRLSWENGALHYCAGQYYPMEFRAAACSVLASALWAYWRESNPTGSGDDIRKTARRELGAAIGREWFR
jgi:hypothetical protein